MTRSWQVLLIGGASGAGKTSISYHIAHHFGVGITNQGQVQAVFMYEEDGAQIRENFSRRAHRLTYSSGRWQRLVLLRKLHHKRVGHMLVYKDLGEGEDHPWRMFRL